MSIGTSQAFRTQNLRLLGNLFDKNNFIGKKGYYLNSTGDGVDWRADLNETSGIFYGGIISATIGGTTFNLSAGSGQVVTRVLVNNDVVTTNKIVSWNTQNNVALTYRTTHQFSYLYIDENGALQQQNSPFTDSEYKNKIILGTISHINLSTINLVINKHNTAYGDSHRLYEFANAFGPIKRSGLSIGPYSTNLRITRGAGSAFSIGSNYASDQFEADSSDIAAANPALINRVYRNGSGGFIFDSNSGSFYTDIDPTKYDNGSGTLQTVNNNQWTIQRLFFFPINVNEIVVYYGDAIYNSSIDAIAAISTEPFSESIITSENAVFLGYLVIRGGAADLSSSNDGVFFQSGAFRSIGAVAGGGVGSVVTTLDELTDVQIATPLGGQFLTYDSTTSFWKNRSFILDANNNELIKFPSTIASAVNELTISNAATTGSPSISATGDDTNIGLNLISKGTGLIQINGKAISLANSFTTSGNFALTFTTTATTSLTLPTSGTLATTSQIPTVNNATLTLAGSGGIGIDSPPTFTANASADKTITISIADGALTIAKLADIATLRILGRTSPSTGPVEVLDGTGVVSVIGTNAVTRATNLAGGIAGQIPYQSGANTTAFSAAGSTNQVLLSGGSGAPTWANQSSLSVGSATTAGSLANALTISSPLTGTSYNGSAAISIGLQNASDSQAGGVSIGAQTFAGNKTFKDNVIVSGNLTVNGTTVTINSSTLSVDDKNIELGSVVAIPSLSATVNIDAGDTNVTVSSTNGLIVGQALTKISGTGAFGANPVISSITSATQFTVSPVHATTGSIVFSVGGATDVTADGGGITLKGTTDKTIIWVDSTDAWTLSEHLNIASGKSYRINGTDVLSSTTLGSGVVNSSLTSVGTLTNLTVTNTITGSVSGSAGSLSGTYTFWGQNFNGTQNVSGNLTSVGNITGTGGITITAGGSNQNVVLTPSGTGYTLLNGNVGIGTTVPLATLDVRNQVMIGDASIGGVAYQTLSIGGHTRIHGTYRLQFGSANGGYASMGITGPQTGTITFNTWDGSADRERLRIVNTDGNVGIGTTNPVQKLDVSGSIYINNNASYLYGKTTGGSATRMIGINAVNDFYIGSVDQAVSSIRINNNGSDRVIIDSSGNVGIGITNLTYKLDVAGAIAMHDENQDIDSRFYGGTFLRGWSAFEAGNESNITYTTDTTCPVGIEVLSISTWTWARGPKIRLDKTQNYEVEFWVKRHAANTSGQFYFVVSNFDSNGTRITGDGTDWHYPTTFAQNTMVVGTWYKFKFIVGPYGGAKDHSPNARYISVGFIVNYTTGTDVIYMTGFKCRPIPRYNNDNLTLYNNGFVGIGTTIPSEKLDVIGGNISTSGEIYSLGGRLSLYRSAGNSYIDWSTGRNLIFRTETSVGGAGDSEKVRIDTNGNVGIGTTNPFNKLDIYGGDVNIRNDSAGATSLYLRNWVAGGTTQMVFGVAAGDDQSTSLSFAGNVFKIENYGDPTSSIKFGTRNTAGTSAIRMTINPDGNVGIDTETPNNKLSVLGSTSIGSGYNTAAPTNGLIVEGGVGFGRTTAFTTGGTAQLSISTDANSVALSIGASNTDMSYIRRLSAGVFQWQTFNGANDGQIHLQPYGGNVGIGTTNPNDRLTILAGNYLSFQTVNLTFNSGRAARIGTTTTGSGIGELIFETYKGGSGGGEKMRINSDGNLGIGISTPVYKTEIYSGAKTSAFTGLAISNFNDYTGNPVTSQLRFAILENPITTYDASQRTFAILESGNEINNSSSDGFFAISTRKNAVLSEKFRITSLGNIGVGTTNPVTKLAILGGDDKDTGPIISLSGNSVNQFESGRIRFTEVVTGAAPFYQGAYLHYDGSNNLFHIGVHDSADSLIASDTNAISIVRSNGNVGIGTTNPVWKLDVSGSGVRSFATGAVEPGFIVDYDSTNGYGGFFLHTNGTRKWRIGNVGDTSSNPALFIWQEGVGARMYFKNDGLIGIGTTSPAGKLDVYENSNAGHTSIVRNVNAGSSAYSAFFLGNNEGNNKLVMFTNSSTRTGDGGAGNSTIRTDSGKLYLGAGATQHILDTTGNVGIGNTSPNNKLAVSGSASIGSNYNIAAPTNGLIVEGNVAFGLTNPSSYASQLTIETTQSRAIMAFNTALADAGTLYGLGFGYAMSNYNSAYISFYKVGNSNTLNRLSFSLWNQNDILNILGNGNVGVGITNPNAKFYVSAGTLAINQRAMFINADITTNTSVYTHTLNLIDSSADANPTSLALGTYSHVVFRNRPVSAGSAGGILDIYTRGVSTDPTVKMTITDVGNVGIGVSSPARKLHVIGDIGAYKDGSDSIASHLYIANVGNTQAYNFQLNSAGTSLNLWGYDNANGWKNNVTFAKAGNVGIGVTSPSAVLHTNSTTSGATLIRVDGTNGTLFSVVDDLSDSLMSVNNSAGLPVLEVFADDRIVAGQYGQNDLVVINNKIGIGTANPINKLSVIGAANIGDSTYNVAAPTNGLIVQGDVGIGTATPTAQSNYRFLQVNGTNSAVIETMVGGVRIGGFDSTSSALYVGTIGAFPIVFRTGVNEKWRITNAGVLQSSTAQTIQTATGNLTLATFAGDGHILLTPHGTGNVGIGDTTPTAKLDVNGTVRVRTISASGSAATIFLTTDANGILISRTAAQVRSDIGAGTGNGSVTSVNGTGTVSGITLSGTVTTSGDLTLGGTLSVTPSNFASQTANTFLAAPNGAAGVPTFRAMASADIPNDGIVTAKILNSNVTLAKIQNVAISTVLGNSSASAAQAPVEINMTTLATMLSGKTMDIVGTATNVTGVVLIANGGTGTATTTANAFFVGPNGSSGAPSFRAMATADIPASIVTFAKIQDVAGPTLIGRVSATSGPVAALSSANARSVIGATTVGSNLITLADTSTTKKYIEVGADNTVTLLEAAAFRNAIGAGTGNGTVTNVTGNEGITSSGGTTPNISITNGGVTYAKIQNVSATSRILGRISANAGVIEELTGANVATIIGANAIENATNVNITTDDATNSSYYLYFGANASGNTPLKASTKIRYNPNSGAFSATTKSFRIPHPTKPQHDLVYGSLESPYHGIRLTGKGKTSGNRAEIILPDYVKVLIDEETINIQLSVIKCAKILYIDDIFINDNKFTVKYDKSWYEKSKDVEFYWDFTAERKDVPKLIVEEKI